jgi:hypothetical protein
VVIAYRVTSQATSDVTPPSIGLGLEQKGDKAGACSEYIRVLEHGGHARPRSITGETARKHATALGCVLPTAL